MIALTLILGSIPAYLVVGYFIAIWDLPSLYARQREQHPGWTNEKIRDEIRALSTCIGLFWPLCIPYLVMSRETDKRDPQRLEREIAERDAKIAELERRYLQ